MEAQKAITHVYEDKILRIVVMETKWKQLLSLNKFNSQANRDWAHTLCACSHWAVPIRAATCLHPNLPASACVWGSWAYRAQPLPSESKNCPGADVVCAGAGDKDSNNLLGQMYAGTSQDRELFSCALCWLDSKFIKLGRLLWIRDFQGPFCSLVQVWFVRMKLGNCIWEINEK